MLAKLADRLLYTVRVIVYTLLYIVYHTLDWVQQEALLVREPCTDKNKRADNTKTDWKRKANSWRPGQPRLGECVSVCGTTNYLLRCIWLSFQHSECVWVCVWVCECVWNNKLLTAMYLAACVCGCVGVCVCVRGRSYQYATPLPRESGANMRPYPRSTHAGGALCLQITQFHPVNTGSFIASSNIKTGCKRSIYYARLCARQGQITQYT